MSCSDKAARRRGPAGAVASDGLARRRSNWKLQQPEIQHARSPPPAPDGVRQRVEVTAPGFLDFEQAGLAKDPQVLRHVVLRHAHPLRDLADVRAGFHQQPDDANPRLFAERLERDDAVLPLVHRQNPSIG